jgi:hypothetical protein
VSEVDPDAGLCIDTGCVTKAVAGGCLARKASAGVRPKPSRGRIDHRTRRSGPSPMRRAATESLNRASETERSPDAAGDPKGMASKPKPAVPGGCWASVEG